MGNNTPSHRDNPARRRLTLQQEKQVFTLFQQGVRKEVLAVQFGVHFNTIGNIINRFKETAAAASRIYLSPEPIEERQ